MRPDNPILFYFYVKKVYDLFMNKRYIIGLAIFVFLGIAFFVWNNNFNASSLALKNNPVTISPLEQNVSIRQTEISDSVPLTRETEAFAGSIINTSPTGRALIEFSSSTRAVLDFNSELIVKNNETPSQKTALRLISGEVWSRVEKALERGEFYEIQTQNAVASVRGTSFGVEFKEDKTLVVVEKGEVKLIGIDEKTGSQILDSEKIISAGYMGTLSGNGEILVQKISPEMKSSLWYRLNVDSSINSPAIKQEGGVKLPVNDKGTSLPISNTSSSVVLPKDNKGQVIQSFSLFSISPTKIEIPQNGSANVILTGQGFLKLANVLLESKSVSNFKIIDDSKIQISVSADFGSGVFDVSVVNISGSYITLPKALSIVITQNSVTGSPNSAGVVPVNNVNIYNSKP